MLIRVPSQLPKSHPVLTTRPLPSLRHSTKQTCNTYTRVLQRVPAIFVSQPYRFFKSQTCVKVRNKNISGVHHFRELGWGVILVFFGGWRWGVGVQRDFLHIKAHHKVRCGGVGVGIILLGSEHLPASLVSGIQ